MPTFSFANRITHESWDHPELLVAREQGDIEKIDAVLASLRLPNGKLDTRNYVRVDGFVADNINTVEGKMYALDRITGVVTATPTWYIAPFSSDSTPALTWDAGFGEEVGGTPVGDCTEFTDYDEAVTPGGRVEVEFDAATNPGSGSRCETTNSTRAQLTISTGVTNVNIYGVCISSGNTLNSDGAGEFLLAAVRYPQVKVYNAGEVKYLGYQIYIP